MNPVLILKWTFQRALQRASWSNGSGIRDPQFEVWELTALMQMRRWVAPIAQLVKGRLSDAGGLKFESQTGRLTCKCIPSLRRDIVTLHSRASGLQSTKQGNSIRTTRKSQLDLWAPEYGNGSDSFKVVQFRGNHLFSHYLYNAGFLQKWWII